MKGVQICLVDDTGLNETNYSKSQDSDQKLSISDDMKGTGDNPCVPSKKDDSKSIKENQTLSYSIQEGSPVQSFGAVTDTPKTEGTSGKHPGTQCAQFGCSVLVGWSASRGRYARLCCEHLRKHRIRCAQSARKKRARYEEAKQKASLFDRQTISLAAAQEKIKELQDQLAICQREMQEMMLESNM